jgi:hypothetical protein
VLGGADHRFEVAEGGRVDGDLGGDDDLLFGGDPLAPSPNISA